MIRIFFLLLKTFIFYFYFYKYTFHFVGSCLKFILENGKSLNLNLYERWYSLPYVGSAHSSGSDPCWSQNKVSWARKDGEPGETEVDVHLQRDISTY